MQSNMHHPKLKSRNGGFALTELLIALGVVAAILAAIAGVARSLQSGAGASDHARQIETIAGNVHSIYTRASNYSGLTQAVARNLKAFPGEMDDGTQVYNTWNGAVTVVAASDLSGVANRAFTVTTANIPPDVCSDLASNNAGARRVQVGSTTVYQTNVTPLNVAAIATNCNSGPTTVTYLYEKK